MILRLWVSTWPQCTRLLVCLLCKASICPAWKYWSMEFQSERLDYWYFRTGWPNFYSKIFKKSFFFLVNYWEERQVSLKTPTHPQTVFFCGQVPMRVAYSPQLMNLHGHINIMRSYGLQKGSLLVCITSVDSLGAHKCVTTHFHHFRHLRVFFTALNHPQLLCLFPSFTYNPCIMISNL